MKKHLLILIAVMLLLPLSAHAVDRFRVGSSGDGNLVRISENARLYGDGDDSIVLTSSVTFDTLLPYESGKVIICNTDGYARLPDATVDTVGVNYRFSVVGVAAGTGAGRVNTLKVLPAITGDTIVYSIMDSGGTSTALTAGQSLNAEGITGDSLWVICTAADTWHVIDITGTWTAGN